MSYLQQVVEMIVVFRSLLSNLNFYNLVSHAGAVCIVEAQVSDQEKHASNGSFNSQTQGIGTFIGSGNCFQ